MTADEYIAIRDKLGLEQFEVAELFGITIRQTRRWKSHGVNSTTAEILLLLLDCGKIDVEDIENVRWRE